jgi:AcrR family transcriptional regulator
MQGATRVPPAAAEKVRRRRRPEDAEREILEAASELLRERPFHEVTVGEIMRRTTLSRKSFYVYFRDRYDLLTRLVAPIRAELDEANALWLDADSGRDALLRVATILVERGALVRELADAARYDKDAERAWRQFNEPVVAGVAERIRAGTARGEFSNLDPERTARALVGMNLYAFFDQLVGREDADVEGLVDTLTTLWERALGQLPA